MRAIHADNGRSKASQSGRAGKASAIIRSKVAVPPLPQGFVERPRVDRALSAAIERSRVVTVCATAGAGKTTAVVAAVRLLDRPLAWLTVDRPDVASGRLLTYLEAALAAGAPQVRGVVAAALAAGIAHGEAAGLLAEAVGDVPVITVLDDLERLGDEGAAWEVVETLVRYLPPQAALVLVSRREIPAAVRAVASPATLGVVDGGELALTADEATAVLRGLGHAELDAAAAVAATGGWVTGVVFEAWRADHRTTGGGGETDAWGGYLSSQILGALAPAERDFLVSTSVWDEVSAERAQMLGVRNPARQLAALRAAHLPAVWDARGRTMRCHSRFREYLLDLLEQRGEQEVRAVRLAHGRGLAHEGHLEDAAEELLRAGAPEEALPAACGAILGVIERLDFAIAERWLLALADVRSDGAAELTTAELMLALARFDFGRGARIADELAAAGELAHLARSSPQAAWTMVFCYLGATRPDGVRAVLDAAPGAPGFDVVRYFVEVVDGVCGEGGLVAPEPTGGPVDALLYVAAYQRGYLREIEGRPQARLAELFTRPLRIAALRALGQTQRALELYEEAKAAGISDLALQTLQGPEVLIDAGRRRDALQAIAEGRRAAAATGSPSLMVAVAVAEAKLALRLDRDPAAALAVLGLPGWDGRLTRVALEYVDTWYGLALLMQSEDHDAAVRLRRAVDSMVAGDRWLELPTAAVYLAEAEWRLGDEEAADRAADLALQAARRQGSHHMLLQALADYPAVLSRRLDAEARPDSPWHDLGRALIAQGAPISATLGSTIELKEFGARAIIVDGTQVAPRVAKAYELLAYLVSDGHGCATRDELLDALFDRRSDHAARSYLSQAIAALREVLPAGCLVCDQRRVRLGGSVGVTSDSVRLGSALAEAARLHGTDRMCATLDALAVYGQGEYLPGRRSSWADDRALELADDVTDARLAAADLAFKAGRLEEARRLNAPVLAQDPTREAAWRLAMRIANSLGDQDGVLGAYRACVRALSAIGVTPAPSTRQMVDDLRS